MNLKKTDTPIYTSSITPKAILYRMVITIAFFFSLQACQTQPEENPKNLESVTLQLKWKHQFQFAGYYAALEQGYYEAAGLDVQLLEAPDGEEPAQVVLDGGADFGIAASDLLLMRAKGQPVVALASIYQHSPLVLLSIADRGMDNIHNLAGEKVMIEAHAAELLAYLESEGISPHDLTLLPHSFDPEALISGQAAAISAYSTDEPFLLQQHGLEYLVFNPRASGIDFYGDTLFTTETTIQENPEQVKAFLDASLRGWAYALDHSEEIVDLVYSKYSQRHTKEHLLFEADKTKQLILPDVVEIGYMNPGRWQRIAEIYTEMNMTPEIPPLDDFLYERDPKTDLTWFYLLLLAVLAVLGITTWISTRFYRLNTALQKEISERVKTEANLRILEERYRVLSENAPFPIVISHLENGKLLYINHQTAQKFGITQSGAVGEKAREFYVNPADRDELFSLLKQQGYVQNFDVQLVTPKGTKFWATISANNITFEGQPAVFSSIMDITDRRDLAVRMERMAMEDELTALANRRHFMQRIQSELNRAKRYQTPLCLLLLDADQLKKINDTHGHAAGDQMLRKIATTCRDHFRESDFPGRIGGDEFGIILPNTSLQDGLRLAERLRDIIGQQRFEINGKSVQFTISIGAAALSDLDTNIDDLLRKADIALYQAKNVGGNQAIKNGA